MADILQKAPALSAGKTSPDTISQLAVRALLCEVTTTPKSGLVDRDNSGAHRDMDIHTFIRSAVSLGPYFSTVAHLAGRYKGPPENLLEVLRPIGIAGETVMLAATRGVNTHKGLVFSLGLVCAALGLLSAEGHSLSIHSLLQTCARMCNGQQPRQPNTPASHGQFSNQAYGLPGAFAEAAAGFPCLMQHGYPVFQQMVKSGFTLNDAGVAALLHLMAHMEDTNIAYRAGLNTLRQVQRMARDFLKTQPSMPQMLQKADEWNTLFVQQNISPGGSADMLALCFMLYFVLEAETGSA